MADSKELHFLEVRDDMTADELLRVLRVNAIRAHQISVGRGDELVQLLKRAVNRMETAHSRIQNLSVVFFIFGLGTLVAGVYAALFAGGGKEVWGTILGAAGGLGSLVSLFYSTPMDKIARSVNDLIQLETAFLGYIRVVGEVDSAFQWQYIEKMAGGTGALSDVTRDATNTIKDMMTHTMKLIDEYCGGESESVQKLNADLQSLKADFEQRWRELEARLPASS